MDKAMLSLIEKSLDLLEVGIFACLGGAAAYLRSTVLDPDGPPFRFMVFVANISVAFIVGLMVGEFFEGHQYRDGILIACGYACFPILDAVEAKVRSTVKNVG